LETLPDLLGGLMGLLEEQEALIRRLIELGREETRALKAEDLAGLSALIAEQEQCGRKLRELEVRRLSLQLELARQLGLVEGESSLQGLAERVGPGGEELVNAVKRLRRSFEELKELNRINRALVQQALTYINRVLALLGAGTGGYDHEGQVKVAPEQTRVNTVV
jgi:flagellar biosynthesis/type III secretory pathway chaperone